MTTADVWSSWESFNRLERSNQEKADRLNVLEKAFRDKTDELKQIRHKTSLAVADLDSKQSLVDYLSAEARITRKRLELTQLLSDALDQDLTVLASRRDAAVLENNDLITASRDKIRASSFSSAAADGRSNFERLVNAQGERKAREDCAVEGKRGELGQLRERIRDLREKVRGRQEVLEELDNMRASSKVYAERLAECAKERERMRRREEELRAPGKEEVVEERHQREMRRLQDRLEELRRVRDGLAGGDRAKGDQPTTVFKSLDPVESSRKEEEWSTSSSSSTSSGFFKLSLDNQQNGKAFVFRPIPRK